MKALKKKREYVIFRSLRNFNKAIFILNLFFIFHDNLNEALDVDLELKSDFGLSSRRI